MERHFYYLHENGELIHKRDMEGIEADFRESPFVKAFWALEPEDRMTAWTLLVEALALGAHSSRIVELALKWACNDEDADEYAKRIGVEFVKEGNHWRATSQAQGSKFGLGVTKLVAMAELAKALGLKPGKTWNAHFTDLLKPKVREGHTGTNENGPCDCGCGGLP